MSKKKPDDDDEPEEQLHTPRDPKPKSPAPKAEQPVYEPGEGSTPDPDQPAYPHPPA